MRFKRYLAFLLVFMMSVSSVSVQGYTVYGQEITETGENTDVDKAGETGLSEDDGVFEGDEDKTDLPEENEEDGIELDADLDENEEVDTPSKDTDNDGSEGREKPEEPGEEDLEDIYQDEIDMIDNIVDIPVIQAKTIAQDYEEVEVTIEVSDELAEIYYTTDGSEPTTDSTVYSEPFTVEGAEETVVIKAIALKNDEIESQVAEHQIVFADNLEQVAAPVIKVTRITNRFEMSPLVETITDTAFIGDELTIALSASSGSAIYYTLDGSEPTTSSARYMTSFKVQELAAEEITLKAIAVRTGYADSEVAEQVVQLTNDYTVVEPGKYIVPAKFMHYTEPNRPSMGDDALENDQAIVVVKEDGSMEVELSLKGVSTLNTYGHLLRAWAIPGQSKQFVQNLTMAGRTEMDKYLFKVVETYEDESGIGAIEEFPKVISTVRTQAGENFFYMCASVDAMGGDANIVEIKFVLDWENADFYDERTQTPQINLTRYNYDKKVFEAVDSALTGDQITVMMEASDNAVIYYTIDGSTPTKASEKYTEPFVVTQNDKGTVNVQAVALEDGLEISRTASKAIEYVSDFTPLAPGRYMVPVTMMNVDKTAVSMGDDVLSGAVADVSEDGKAKITLSLQGKTMGTQTAYLEELWAYPGQSRQYPFMPEAEREKYYEKFVTVNNLENGMPKSISITRDQLGENYFYIYMNIDMMPMNQNAVLTFDWEKAELIDVTLSGIILDELTEGDSGEGWSFTDGVLYIEKNGDYTISQRDSSVSTTNLIEVNPNVEAKIKISRLNVQPEAEEDIYDQPEAAAMLIGKGAKVKLVLEGDNYIKSIHPDYAAIQLPNAQLTIMEETKGSVTAQGGKNASSIGGSGASSQAHVNITVDSGTVNVVAGVNGAGIGGGRSNSTEITINGGTINARTEFATSGPAIGGGYWGTATKITINEGIINAEGEGNAPLIGTNIGTCEIIINGGTITAEAERAVAIGASTGYVTYVADITINGGKIVASNNAGTNPAIGGAYTNNVDITINGGHVTATSGGDSGAAIGTGTMGVGDIVINGGTVIAVGPNRFYGLGTGNDKDLIVVINGGSVNTTVLNSSPAFNSNGDRVYLNTLQLEDIDTETSLLSATINGIDAEDKPVSANGVYGIKDVVTDEDGKVYFYLPMSADDESIEVVTEDGTYKATYTRKGSGNNPILEIPANIISVTPNGSKEELDGEVVVTFSKEMNADVGSVTLGTKVLSGSWSADKTIYTAPYSSLEEGKEYEIKLSGFKDKNGEPITASQTYKFTTLVIVKEKAATPAIIATDKADNYTDVIVSIETETADADIYFTLDGSEPDEGALPYSAPITLNDADTVITIKAIAMGTGYLPSDIAEKTVEFAPKDTGDREIENGIYSVPYQIYTRSASGLSMANDAVDGNAVIRVSDDSVYIDLTFKAVVNLGLYGHLLELWSIPGQEVSDTYIPAQVIETYYDYGINYPEDTNKYLFNKVFRIERDKAGEGYFYIRVDVDAMEGSQQTAMLSFKWDEAEKTGDLDKEFASTPTVTPAKTSAENNESVQVIIATETTDADIYYTTDGSVPTEKSSKYTAPFNVTGANTTVAINAIAVKDGFENSTVGTASVKFATTTVTPGGDGDTDVSEDGKYWVDVYLWHSLDDQKSMGDAAFENNRQALITTSGGTSSIQIGTNPVLVSGFTSALKEIASDEVSINVIDKKSFTTNTKYDGKEHTFDYVSVFAFDIPSGEPDYVSVKINVPYTPMDGIILSGGGYIDARIKIDWSTLTKTDGGSQLVPNTSSATGSSDVDSSAVEFADEETGVKITADNNVLPDDAEIKVDVIEEDNASYEKIAEALDGELENFKIYNIDIKANGKDVSVTSNVSLYFPIDESLNREAIVVYRINDDGSITLVNGEVEGDFYVIKTTTFGMFAVGTLPESAIAEKENQIMRKASLADIFTDVENHWAVDAIRYTVDRGLFSGVSDIEFAPDENLTRGMLVTVLGRLDSVNIYAYRGSSFNDVDEEAYYSPYIAWANANNIVSGVNEGIFDPDTPVSREQIAVIFANYAAYKGLEFEGENTKEIADMAQVSDWAADSVLSLTKSGIINGYTDGRFVPQGRATRAEAAMIMMQFIETFEMDDYEEFYTAETAVKEESENAELID